MLIVLDPGHGGHDPGAVGPTGLRESDIVLDVAKRVRDLLLDSGHKVRLTRETDCYVSLSARAEFANRERAELFVSVHCNAATDPRAHGTETWYYPSSVNGRRLAEVLQQALVAALRRRDRGLKTSSNLTVLRRTVMPAALVELAFISNDEEEQLLGLDEVRMAAATAIAEGVRSYIGQIKGRNDK